MKTETLLASEEAKVWTAFRNLAEAMIGCVAADIEKATRLSSADFEVLCHLADAGTLTQQELSTALRWTKSRLSHHLTRMEKRGLLVRSAKSGRNVSVSILPQGQHLLSAATAAHAASVRRHFLARITEEQAALIYALSLKISSTPAGRPNG